MAYLLVGRDGRLLRSGGKMAHYGLNEGWIGLPVVERVACLEGLLPLDSKGMVLASVALMPGLYADLHLFPSAAGDWILFLDVTEEAERLRALQQMANEACLLRAQLARCEQELEALQIQGSRQHETSGSERQGTN